MQYYVEPTGQRRFRSKNEVLHFLETGIKLKRRATSETDAGVRKIYSWYLIISIHISVSPWVSFFKLGYYMKWCVNMLCSNLGALRTKKKRSRAQSARNPISRLQCMPTVFGQILFNRRKKRCLLHGTSNLVFWVAVSNLP